MPVRKVAVLGAGHGGCAAAADLILRGFTVRLHARSATRLAPLRDRGGIEAGGVQTGFATPEVMTTDLAEAINGADIIMLVVPSVAHSYYAEELAPLLNGKVAVMLNPGHTGGGLHFLADIRKAGYALSVYTINDGDVARALVGMGVDCVITDAPDVVLAAIG